MIWLGTHGLIGNRPRQHLFRLTAALIDAWTFVLRWCGEGGALPSCPAPSLLGGGTCLADSCSCLGNRQHPRPPFPFTSTTLLLWEPPGTRATALHISAHKRVPCLLSSNANTYFTRCPLNPAIYPATRALATPNSRYPRHQTRTSRRHSYTYTNPLWRRPRRCPRTLRLGT